MGPTSESLAFNWILTAIPWCVAVCYGLRRVAFQQMRWVLGILAFGAIVPSLGLRTTYVGACCLLASAVVAFKAWKSNEPPEAE